MNNQYLITGVVVTFDDQEPHSRDEAMVYLEHAKGQHGNRIKSLIIRRGEEYTDLNYILVKPPFERIRRITGYLVGTVDRWNDAKSAELKDRVMHDDQVGSLQ
jgi:hypothetical protein